MDELPAPDSVGGLLGEGMDARLARWVADGRIDEAAGLRSKARWLRQQAAESGTIAGVFVDLGERHVEVELHTIGRRSHRGGIELVGKDFVTVRVNGAGQVHVALRAVTFLASDPGVPRSLGDRKITATASLAETIIALSAERERALFALLDGESPICGTVEAVGQDVVVVSLDGGGVPGATAYLALDAIGEVIPRV